MKEKQLCKSIQWWQKHPACWSKQILKMHIYLDTSAHYHLRISVAFCSSKLTDLVHYKQLRVRSMLKTICNAAKKVWIKQWLVKPCLEAKHLRKNKQRMGRGRHLSARQDVSLYSPTNKGEYGILQLQVLGGCFQHIYCAGVTVCTVTPVVLLDYRSCTRALCWWQHLPFTHGKRVGKISGPL